MIKRAGAGLVVALMVLSGCASQAVKDSPNWHDGRLHNLNEEKAPNRTLGFLKWKLFGRRRPVPIPDSEFDIEVDSIVVAIGQGIDAEDYFEDLEYSEWGLIQTDEQSHQTSVTGVFAGGDAVGGPATVVKAVGAGKKAAISIDKYIRGEPVSQDIATPGMITATIDAEKAQATEERRAAMPMLEEDSRITNFDEVELGFDAKTSTTEADRCINC